MFVVPLRMSLESLIKCSKFRTKERLPIMTFFYEYEPKMFTSLFRCSQIKGGILNARCEED
jgi:myotubularin-related protein 1/2